MTEEKPIKVFVTPMTKTVAQQNRIELVLMANKIHFVKIDITEKPEYKDEMRAIMGDDTGLAPQIANGDQYCGDFKSFENAIEDGHVAVFEFLKLPAPQSQHTES